MQQHDLSNAKVVRTIRGERFLVTGTRLYQTESARGRNARKPARYVSLASVRKALKTGTPRVPCHHLPEVYGTGWVVKFLVTRADGYYTGSTFAYDVVSIGCKEFAGQNARVILGE